MWKGLDQCSRMLAVPGCSHEQERLRPAKRMPVSLILKLHDSRSRKEDPTEERFHWDCTQSCMAN